MKDRQLYRVHSRNLQLAIYRKNTNGFLGLRRKFSSTYIFEEYHSNHSHGTATPQEELPDVLPEHIPLEESFGPICEHCRKKVNYDPWPEGGLREITTPSGVKLQVAGHWVHKEETQCIEVHPIQCENKEMHEWLLEMEKKYEASLLSDL